MYISPSKVIFLLSLLTIIPFQSCYTLQRIPELQLTVFSKCCSDDPISTRLIFCLPSCFNTCCAWMCVRALFKTLPCYRQVAEKVLSFIPLIKWLDRHLPGATYPCKTSWGLVSVTYVLHQIRQAHCGHPNFIHMSWTAMDSSQPMPALSHFRRERVKFNGQLTTQMWLLH